MLSGIKSSNEKDKQKKDLVWNICAEGNIISTPIIDNTN